MAPTEHRIVVRIAEPEDGAGPQRLLSIDADDQAVGRVWFDPEALGGRGGVGEALADATDPDRPLKGGALRDLGVALCELIYGQVDDEAADPKIAREVRLKLGGLVDAMRREEVRLSIWLDLPPGLDLWPWEAAYDEGRDVHLAAHPLSAMVRLPRDAAAARPSVRREVERLRVLLILPEAPDLDVAEEARRLGDLFDSVAPGAVVVERTPARVTPAVLQQKLAERDWDVVHFAGHADVDGKGNVRIRLNDERRDELWLLASQFSSHFQGRRTPLVVLNCCLAGTPSNRAGVAGLAPNLVSHGACAVVAMTSPINDLHAIRFATAFYGSLLGATAPGRADVAVAMARRSLLQTVDAEDARGIVTPVLYHAPGEPRILALPARSAAPSPVAAAAGGAPARRPAMALPPGLVAAVREGRCVPVIGPGVLVERSDALRRAGTAVDRAAASPVRALAMRLAEAGYPERDELALTERDPWEFALLARVAQFFEAREKRFKLEEAVVKWVGAFAVRSRAVSALARLRPSPPGAVHTFYDHLVGAALEARGFASVPSLDAAARTPTAVGRPLLVHLRGTIARPKLLRLTELDHDLLWEQMGGLPPTVAALVAGAAGCSLLFVGVNPRDAWTKRFAQALVAGVEQTPDTMYFVTPSPSPVDELCWSGFEDAPGIEWIDADPHDVMEALANLAGAEVAA